MIQSKFLEAMKETLTRKLDRKRASPTESAVMRDWVWEHSGAGILSVCNKQTGRLARWFTL